MVFKNLGSSSSFTLKYNEVPVLGPVLQENKFNF